jgi:hypothetical protein
MRLIYVVLITTMALLGLVLAVVSVLRAQGQQPPLIGMAKYDVLLTGSVEMMNPVGGHGASISTVGSGPVTPPR